VPERHEPDVGEVNYPYPFRLLDQLLRRLDRLRIPPCGAAAHATSEGLGWIQEWL
jgi:hydroxypyruvate isomerase